MGKCKDCKSLCRTLPAYPGPYELENADSGPVMTDTFARVKRLTWCINTKAVKCGSDVRLDHSCEHFDTYVPMKREIRSFRHGKKHEAKPAKSAPHPKQKAAQPGVPDRRPKLSDKPPMHYNH